MLSSFPKYRTPLALGCACLLWAVSAYAQARSAAQPDAGARRFAYEVVSIKPHKSDARGMWWRTAADGFSTSGSSVEGLIVNAYGLVMNSQISGLPAWARSDTFDIQARMDKDTMAALAKLPQAEFHERQEQMMQTLLAGRFQLKVHHETRQLPVYNLVVAKSGIKMKVASANEKGTGYISPRRIKMQACEMGSLAPSLSRMVGRLVVDKTDLRGKYDFTFRWTPFDEREQTDTGPSIFTALEEQLGLKLISARGPVDTIVVDHVERPSPN